MAKSDTIAAIATALSNAGIGIIRISGEDSYSIAHKIFRSKNQTKSLLDFHSHTIHYGYIYNDNELVDEVMISVMKAPYTFTTEDTVEINCHGGIVIMNQILSLVLKSGARLAEPGEFSKRAFLNGRIDLSKAEAIMDLIHAKNELAVKSSVKQLTGSLSAKVKDIREQTLYEIAFIESALDDPEHISLEGYSDKLCTIVNNILIELNSLYESSKNGKLIAEGIKTVIIGKPNAGKSTFMNYMVGEDKAIVTHIPGTTRDILEQHIMLEGISLHMIDTAGIRYTDNEVEKIGVQRSKEYSTDADLLIYMIDASMDFDDEDIEILELIQNQKVIVVLNKSDLEPKVTEENLRKYEILSNKNIIPVSMKNEIGTDMIHTAIKELFYTGTIDSNNEIMITNMRHKQLLRDAIESLELVKNSIVLGMPEDFLSIDLMDAYSSLGFIIGEEVTEDLVNEIFAKFCTGK